MSEIHPLVLASLENERARSELDLERLRSARATCLTAAPGGQNRAMSLGKRIREAEAVAGSWRLVLATVLSSMEETAGVVESATGSAQALRDALPSEPSTVAYRGRDSGLLICRKCGEGASNVREVSSEDLPDGGFCFHCHADVLA